jgi:hypothetical protein
MTDYLNPSKIYNKPMTKRCLVCSALIPDEVEVCDPCIKQRRPTTQESKNECRVKGAPFNWCGEQAIGAPFDEYGMENPTTQESLPVGKINAESAIFFRTGSAKVRNLMGLKIWLVQQIEKETDEVRLRTLKRMLEGEGV